MAEAAFNLADWISLADVGENVRRCNGYHDGLARGDVLAALEAGCGLMLRWVGDDGREACREFPKRDSWEEILVWAGLPRRLCIQLPPNERKGSLPYPYAYLLRTDTVRLGLLPASEWPQAKQQSEPQQPPPATQSDEPAITDPAPAASARHPVDETKQTSADPERIAPAATSAADVGDQDQPELQQEPPAAVDAEGRGVAVTTETAGAQPKERRGTRGPPPEKTDLVANRIRADIRAKHFTMREGRLFLFKGLRRVPQKQLTAKYDCGKSTLLDALSIVWSEFLQNSDQKTPTNSDNK